MALKPPPGSVLQLEKPKLKASAPPAGSTLNEAPSSPRGAAQDVFKQGFSIAGPSGAGATLPQNTGGGVTNQAPPTREELSQKMIPQFTKGLEEGLPGGKEVVNNTNPEMQQDFPDPEGMLPWLSRQTGKLAPVVAMATPFEGAAGAIPGISKLGRAAVGFGGYEGTKDVAQGKFKEAPVDALATTAMIWGGGKALELGAKGVAEGAKLAGKGISKASIALRTITGKLSESELGQFINKSIQKSIGMGGAGKTSSAGADRYLKNATKAVNEIISRKSSLKFTNELGDEVTGQLPKSLDEFSHAIDQTKEAIFKEYDAMSKEAGQKGVQINWSPVADDIEAQVSDPAVRTVFPELTAYASDLAERLRADKTVTPESAQKVIAMLNSTLKAYNRNPNPQMASRVVVDLAIATKLRIALDDAIESATGEGYSELKRAYGALRAIQENVARRAAASGSKGAGALDLVGILTKGDIVSGLASLNAPQVAKGAVEETLRQWIRYINNPNRVVKNMFEVAEKHIKPLEIKAPGTPKFAKALPAPAERKLLPAPKPLTWQEKLANKGTSEVKPTKALPHPTNLGEDFERVPEAEAKRRLKEFAYKYWNPKKQKIELPEDQVFGTREQTLLKKMGIDPFTGEIKFKPLRSAFQKAVERFKGKAVAAVAVGTGLAVAGKAEASEANTVERLKNYEGFAAKPYKDLGGKAVGYGFSIKDHPDLPKDVISGKRGMLKTEADKFIVKYYKEAQGRARKFFGSKNFDKLSTNQKEALSELAYQSNITGFKKVRNALATGQMDKLVKELQKSQWYKTYNTRAKKVVELFQATSK